MSVSESNDLFSREGRALTNEERARIAFFRFGLGPKPGGIASLSRFRNLAIRACLRELKDPNLPLLPLGPEFSAEACGKATRNSQISGQYLFTELAHRHAKHMEPRVGFVERLVMFWSNHFSIDRHKTPVVRGTIGHFERTVIRPNVLGSYADMLKAAVMHPALIRYLDNHRSTKNAPNENLAREVLELYTVGSKSLYTQDDVIALSRMLTGWTVEPRGSDRVGQFRFNAGAHAERASYSLMGQQFAGPGMEKVIRALDWLARHPNTSRHLAEKLLRHFGWDEPPAPEVSSLASVVAQGTLTDVARALVLNERLWVAPYRIRPPHLWVVAQARALGFDMSDFYNENDFRERNAMTRAEGPSGTRMQRHWLTRLSPLGNAPWGRPTPDGYPDRSQDWINPNAMRLRIGLARQILVDAEARGRTLPDAASLRQGLLPGSTARTDLSRAAGDRNKAALADLFLTSEFMIR